MLNTIPNHMPEVLTTLTHLVPLPACCPISRNPQPGSTLSLTYTPQGTILEVISLHKRVQQAVGGLKLGETVVRDVEHLIQVLTTECAHLLNVPVLGRARLVLVPEQRLFVAVRAMP